MIIGLSLIFKYDLWCISISNEQFMSIKTHLENMLKAFYIFYLLILQLIKL